ncbi:hypothetical protein NDU88_006705 [Pleurodeles waltl]|uniref:Uncharacterized protein n=1 Tax=Pleurodeles waltl TaxID=8319 RepID=A0AAV7QMJ8_PLEWA|nr:hypothetical protein NDU88_006705 [Pleurodeles waltl]
MARSSHHCVVAYSFVSAAPQRGPLRPITSVPQGQFQDLRGAPLSAIEHNSHRFGWHYTAPGGPRVRSPKIPGPPRRLAGDPSVSADQCGQHQPGPHHGSRDRFDPVAASPVAGLLSHSFSVSQFCQGGPVCPGVPAPLYQGRIRGLRAQRHPRARALPSSPASAMPPHRAPLDPFRLRRGCEGPSRLWSGAGSPHPIQRGFRAGAAAPPPCSVPWGDAAAAGQAQHSSPRLSLTTGPHQGRPPVRVHERPRGPEIRTSA